jgi:hypothetical protein
MRVGGVAYLELAELELGKLCLLVGLVIVMHELRGFYSRRSCGFLLSAAAALVAISLVCVGTIRAFLQLVCKAARRTYNRDP